MKKRIPLFLLPLMFVLVSSAVAQNWFKGTFDKALTQAKTEGKMVMIDFFSGG